MSAESPAATTEVEAPLPDGTEPEPKSAESAPAVTDTDEDATVTVNKKTSDGISSRIDELTRNWRQEQRRNDALMQLLGQDRAEPKALEPAEISPAGKTLADFGYDEGKFQAHLFKEARAEAVKAAREELSREQELKITAEVEAAFSARENALEKTLPDYRDVTRDPSWTGNDSIVEIAKTSEYGPQILYHLAKNRTLAASIERLPPLQQAREIGRLEVKLTEKPPVKVSAAPPPAPKLDASDAKVTKDPSEMTDSEFAAWRRKQMARR